MIYKNFRKKLHWKIAGLAVFIFPFKLGYAYFTDGANQIWDILTEVQNVESSVVNSGSSKRLIIEARRTTELQGCSVSYIFTNSGGNAAAADVIEKCRQAAILALGNPLKYRLHLLYKPSNAVVQNNCVTTVTLTVDSSASDTLVSCSLRRP